MTENCENCRFWKELEGSGMGDCRRYPPMCFPQTAEMVEMDEEHEGYWDARHANRINSTAFPHTHQDDWCGEFQVP
jgi:hypothetical protein